MEFDEMKKIWDSQNSEHLYVVNEDALHNRIRTKKKRSQQLVTLAEIVILVSLLVAGSMILLANIVRGEHIIFKYFAAIVFYLGAAYLWFKRSERKKGEGRFEHTMMGDLEHALSNSNHQVMLSGTFLYKVFPVISIGALVGEWVSSGFSWMIPAIVAFFIVMYFASRWEHGCYVSKLRELESLKAMLVE